MLEKTILPKPHRYEVCRYVVIFSISVYLNIQDGCSRMKEIQFRAGDGKPEGVGVRGPGPESRGISVVRWSGS